MKYDKTHKAASRNECLIRRYGITAAEYDIMLDAQGGVCAICGTAPNKRRLDVDHSHETGEVRELLCPACNVVLGLVGEDIGTLKNIIKYIRKHI
jgi:hypothetical protein